jgi:hypothetical protein
MTDQAMLARLSALESRVYLLEFEAKSRSAPAEERPLPLQLPLLGLPHQGGAD